jgi:hypothetical protein
MSPDRNTPGNPDPENEPPCSCGHVHLLSVRAAVIFFIALMSGTAAGILASLGGARLPGAVLTGAAAGGSALALLNILIG